MKRILIIAIVTIATGCGKFECVKNAAPEMIGDWVHYSENDGFHWIYVQENGRGSMYGENNHGNIQDTSGRGWYVKNDVLYFSRWQNNDPDDKFEIDLYPEVASTEVLTGFDTIPVGVYYMILNGREYKKSN